MYGTGTPQSPGGGGAAIAAGTGGSVGSLAFTGFHTLFFVVFAVTLLVAGFVLVRLAAHGLSRRAN